MSNPITEWNSPEEIRGHIISKAADNSEFRASLIADPKAAINAELGIDIPDGVSVSVVEDSATAVNLVLPPSSQLSPEVLNEIGGGQTFCESNGSPACYS